MSNPKKGYTKVTIKSYASLDDYYKRTLKDIREKYPNADPLSRLGRDDGTSHPNEATDTSIPSWMTNSGKEVG